MGAKLPEAEETLEIVHVRKVFSVSHVVLVTKRSEHTVVYTNHSVCKM